MLPLQIEYIRHKSILVHIWNRSMQLFRSLLNYSMNPNWCSPLGIINLNIGYNGNIKFINMTSFKEYRQNYLGMCQQSPCSLETTVLCDSHKARLWSIWAILMHSEWTLNIKNEPNFFEVSLDVIGKVKNDLRDLYNNFKEINYRITLCLSLPKWKKNFQTLAGA